MIYVYKCPECGDLQEVQHRMLYGTAILCQGDGAQMHRVPQLFRVNWDGPAPSQFEIHPTIRRHMADAPRKRDEYWRQKEDVQSRKV